MHFRMECPPCPWLPYQLDLQVKLSPHDASTCLDVSQLLPGKTDAGRKRGLGESVTDATVGRRKILIGGNVRQGAGADGRFVCVSSANSLELLKVELTGFPNDFFWCRK